MATSLLIARSWPRFWRELFLRLVSTRPAQRARLVVKMADQDSYVLRDAAGICVVCEEGKVWITQEKDSGDIVLQPGGRAHIGRRGKTVALALGPCRLRIEPLDSR
jgi:hypothetical protein